MPEPYTQEQHTYQIPPRNETVFSDGNQIDLQTASPDLLPLEEARARREAAEAFRHGEVLGETEFAIKRAEALKEMRSQELDAA